MRYGSIAFLVAATFGACFATVPPATAQLVAGDVYVTDFAAGTDCTGGGLGCGAVFRVDPTTGQRTLISDFGNAAQGPLGRAPFAAAFDADGLLVLAQWAGTDCTGSGVACGALFRVNTATGARQL